MIARLSDGNRQLSAKCTEVEFISCWPSRKINSTPVRMALT